MRDGRASGFGGPALTGLSPIALGCEQLGGVDWGNTDVDGCRDAVRRALDLGVTVFDTADVYGLGRSEEELSRALAADRHRVTIVTKGGIRWAPGAPDARAETWRDSSGGYLASAIDASLRRLRLDAIPLYLVHAPHARVAIDETLSCLEAARRAGKIVRYGLSNFDAATVRRASEMFPVAAIEGPCHLLEPQSAVEQYRDLRRAGLVVLTYGPLAQGLLTGKYSADSVFEATDRRHRLPHFSKEAWRRHAAILETVRAIADESGCAPVHVAIRWVLDSGAASAVIVGARSPSQVTENLGALGWALTSEQMQRLAAARRTSIVEKE